MKFLAFALLFAAVAHCQETLDDETSLSNIQDRKEKRGISLNLGSGLEGYSYLGPSYGRGTNYRQGYTPVTEYGYDGVNYGVGASNFASGYGGGYQGYNQPYGNYPYRGPTSYQNQRQYNVPINTFPLGGIGTVGPYGGGYGGFAGGFNRFGSDGLGFGGPPGFQQQGFQQPGFQQPLGGLF